MYLNPTLLLLFGLIFVFAPLTAGVGAEQQRGLVSPLHRLDRIDRVYLLDPARQGSQ